MTTTFNAPATITNTAQYDGFTAHANTNVPARELFESAGGLFTVEKRELHFPKVLDAPRDGEWDFSPSGTFGVVRTDTQALLGVVSKQYEIVQNDSLLRMAEFIREEVKMDAVTLMGDGAKLAFTAYLRGAEQDVVPGDSLRRRIVGYLGHDGKTGCGAMFTTIRVICSNTLAAAMSRASERVSISHKAGANENFDSLITSIDCARETFEAEVDLYKRFTEARMGRDEFREFLERVYAPQLAKPVPTDDGNRKRNLDDLQVYPKLVRAFNGGMGQREFAPGTLWSGVNAITEIATSTKHRTEAEAKRQFVSANFGTGFSLSKRAIKIAEAMLPELV